MRHREFHSSDRIRPKNVNKMLHLRFFHNIFMILRPTGRRRRRCVRHPLFVRYLPKKIFFQNPKLQGSDTLPQCQLLETDTILGISTHHPTTNCPRATPESFIGSDFGVAKNLIAALDTGHSTSSCHVLRFITNLAIGFLSFGLQTEFPKIFVSESEKREKERDGAYSYKKQ